MYKILISLIVVLICGALFFGTYILNSRTPKPEGCKELEEECATCPNTSCSLKRKE